MRKKVKQMSIVNYPEMNTDLPELTYSKQKVMLWLYLLHHNKRPESWSNPSKKGTEIHYYRIDSLEEYEQGLVELQAYIDTTTLDIALNL